MRLVCIISGSIPSSGVGDYVIYQDLRGSDFCYSKVIMQRGNQYVLKDRMVPKNKTFPVIPVENMAIGTICLAGLIETENDYDHVQLKEFELKSIGQNYVFGNFLGKTTEIKLQKAQLCQLPTVKQAKMQKQAEKTECNLSDQKSDSIKLLTQVNQVIMQEYYSLHNQYQPGKSQLAESGEKLIDLNSHYMEALHAISDLKSELLQQKAEITQLHEENVKLKDELSHLRVINEVLKTTYKKRITQT